MRGRKAKAVRRLARSLSEGRPYREYLVDGRTVHLRPDTTRAIQKRIKTLV